ncbi:ERF family protein [Fusobacterium pseudoperiodonticum]|uniref:Recombinase n=1 Tax=Fusobacterium pseudoperiodonticum TaxID=2663009 RepID=A0AAD0AN44_9FUSO|nr:ERF family protein [Fusobacterium pseudoperiodonticum]ATV34649.1 recombinase [Fusobacterium pseudoperiodonticum]ATV62458.1 recombinase [Fusobacterium pseudoperiodonticum]
MNIYEKLLKVQVELKAPKGQYNSFGKYKYRSCEDILEALKPVLDKLKLTLFISDEIVEVGGSYKTIKKDETVESEGRKYVKATITLVNIEKPDEIIKISALAREEETKKGQDGSQITGTSSSYARKYALNGLFLIDDTKDNDTSDSKIERGNRAEEERKKVEEYLNSRPGMIERLKENLSSDKLEKVLKAYKVEEIWQMSDEQLKEACEKIFKK